MNRSVVPPPPAAPSHATSAAPRLARDIGLAGLVATALCAMVGVAINIIPFAIQRSMPGLGDTVPYAYVVAAVPASLAALCYAILASAMPRAGGGYVFATRGLSPYLGFLASFAQWFGLSMGMGVVAYLLVPMLRDLVATFGWPAYAMTLDRGAVRVPLALVAIWVFWAVNRAGVKTYERMVLVMAAAMIVGPILMTVVGMSTTTSRFAALLDASQIPTVPDAPLPAWSWRTFLSACVVLFSSFIGFDAIAQAGGEARHPSRNLPLAIVLAIGTVTLYNIGFTAAVYHAVPWEYVYRAALVRDVSAPGLLAPLMPPWLGVVILLAVAVAIADSIPSVMLGNSRLLYAFARDGVVPRWLGAVHPVHRTPHHALTATAMCGSASVLGCHAAGDFFLGVDLLVVSMLVSFVLMAVTVLTLPRTNPAIHRKVTFLRSRRAQVVIAGLAAALLAALLVVQVATDLTAPSAWYMKSTTIWAVVTLVASAVFARSWASLRADGIDPRRAVFDRLPDE